MEVRKFAGRLRDLAIVPVGYRGSHHVHLMVQFVLHPQEAGQATTVLVTCRRQPQHRFRLAHIPLNQFLEGEWQNRLLHQLRTTLPGLLVFFKAVDAKQLDKGLSIEKGLENRLLSTHPRAKVALDEIHHFPGRIRSDPGENTAQKNP